MALNTDDYMKLAEFVATASDEDFSRIVEVFRQRIPAAYDSEAMMKRVRKIHSVVLALACALDGIMENGCEPGQFVPALYGVEAELDDLESDMEGMMECR